MKKIYNALLLVSFLFLGTVTMVSCNNSGQKDQGSNAEDTEKTTVNFDTKVQDFDSSWKERLQKLDESIAQWDSSAKTYKGSLQDRMEKHIKKAKEERDSLKEKLGSLQDQTEDGWDDFKHGVRNQYSEAVESMKKVGEEIRK